MYIINDFDRCFLFQVMFNAVLENACSEQGARMSAMDSSSRNAGEMLDRLTLTYNRFFFSFSCIYSLVIMEYPSSEIGTRGNKQKLKTIRPMPLGDSFPAILGSVLILF